MFAVPRRGLTLIKRVYVARVIVLSLGLISVGSVLIQNGTHIFVWVFGALYCLVWPHVSYQIEIRTSQPYQTAMRTLLIDSTLVGMWVPLLSFNLLPCVAILSMTGMSNMGVGGSRLWRRGCLVMFIGSLIGIGLVGFEFKPATSMVEMMATLPLFLFYPTAVGALSYRLASRLSLERNKLDHLSKHDGLSGLLNRKYCETLIAEEYARRHSISTSTIILADIDFFKLINDQKGHAAGDEVIRGFSELLQANARETDRVARYGGEEFMILLPNTALATALEVAERLRAALENTPLADSRVTASFGVAELSDKFTDYGGWIRCADTALYQAKSSGRNCIRTYDGVAR